jgi:glycosyltransferase involved in cell wall biosynthesis
VRRPLKLLLLNYEFPPLGGGAANATYHTALELARRGHDVQVLTSRARGGCRYEEMEGVRVTRVASLRRGIHKCGLGGAATFLASAAVRLPGMLARHRFDLLHYYFSLPTGMLSFYTRDVRGLPYVVSLRGSDVPGYDETHRELNLLHRLLRIVNLRVWHRAESVVALSDSLRELALRADPDQPVEIIPNGIDTERFAPGEPKTPGGHDTVRLICVSRLVPRKGLEVLLEAVRELSDLPVELEIVGRGELEASLRRRIAELGLERRVQLAGYVPQSKLGARYRHADLFVLPSFAESFGLVLLEAMSTGLPVVATRVGGIPETVSDGVNGLLVEPGSALELTRAIRALILDPERRRRMGEKNVALVTERFGWPRIAEAYEEVYYRALTRAGQPLIQGASAERQR